jgi:hypothetical protein
VLNDVTVTQLVYRKLSVSSLLGYIGRISVNAMVIGRDNSWRINSRMANSSNFIGTRKAIGLTKQARNNYMQAKLRDLALQYATTETMVRVYCLYD